MSAIAVAPPGKRILCREPCTRHAKLVCNLRQCCAHLALSIDPPLRFLHHSCSVQPARQDKIQPVESVQRYGPRGLERVGQGKGFTEEAMSRQVQLLEGALQQQHRRPCQRQHVAADYEDSRCASQQGRFRQRWIVIEGCRNERYAEHNQR